MTFVSQDLVCVQPWDKNESFAQLQTVSLIRDSANCAVIQLCASLLRVKPDLQKAPILLENRYTWYTGIQVYLLIECV